MQCMKKQVTVRAPIGSQILKTCAKKKFRVFWLLSCFAGYDYDYDFHIRNAAINIVRFVHLRCSYYIWSILFCFTSQFKKNLHQTCSRSDENNSFIIIRCSFSLVQFRFSLVSVSLSPEKRKHGKKVFFGQAVFLLCTFMYACDTS